jgi:hypothetical protein
MTRISKGCLSILSSAFILGVVSILSAQPSAPPAADPALSREGCEGSNGLPWDLGKGDIGTGVF